MYTQNLIWLTVTEGELTSQRQQKIDRLDLCIIGIEMEGKRSRLNKVSNRSDIDGEQKWPQHRGLRNTREN